MSTSVTPTPNELRRLNFLDIIIGLNDDETRYLLKIWRLSPRLPKSDDKERSDGFLHLAKVSSQLDSKHIAPDTVRIEPRRMSPQ